MSTGTILFKYSGSIVGIVPFPEMWTSIPIVVGLSVFFKLESEEEIGYCCTVTNAAQNSCCWDKVNRALFRLGCVTPVNKSM